MRPQWGGVRLYLPARADKRKRAARRFERELRSAAADAGINAEHVDDVLVYLSGQYVWM